MKRIFKFFPVALAAFALASCSSDDLNVTNPAGELLNVDGKLLVQVEGGDEGTMRSGFMTTVNPSSAKLRTSFFFNSGDQLKLYHDATSWKPEVWTATAFGQYKNAEGIAVFEKTDAEIQDSENAYGIFPADLGQFGNENRTSLKYDLSGLKFINYAADAQDFNDGIVEVAAADDATGNTKAYKAPFPLWGVKRAGAKVMTVKHLAGILRLDLANMDNSTITNTNARYIVIQSTNKLTGDLATAADVFAPTTAEAVDPDDLMSKAPKLVTATATGTTALTAVPTTKAGITNDDIIVVELSKALATDPDLPNHVMLFVPITAGNAGDEVKVYVSNIVTKGTNIAVGSGATNQAKMGDGTTDAIYTLDAATIQAENKDQLSESGFNSLTTVEQSKVQAGVFYRINDDSSNQNTTAKTPWEMAQGIIAADQAAYRDFEITFTLPIEVKNEDTAPQNFYLDLSGENTEYGLAGYDLKHNVTVNVELKKSADATTNPATLYIKTKSASSEKLTLNIKNNASAIDSIVVKEGELRSNLVLKEATGSAQLPKIQVYKGNDDKITLEAGTAELITGSNITIDNATSKKVDDIKLAAGIKKLSLLNGEVTKIEIADGTGTNPKPINGNVNIYTEGNASIAEVDYANMPKTTTAGISNDTYNLVYSSKWIATSTAGAPTTKITGETAKYITSAAQLAGIAVGTGDVTVLGSYDLDGTNSAWTSLTGLTQNIIGAQYFRFSNAAARAIEGNATITNLHGVNGLIKDWTPTAASAIQNFTFAGGNTVTGTANTGSLGLLVGEIDTQNAAGTVKNISVTGTNSVTGSGNTAANVKGYGAVIGKTNDATNALSIVNVQVASGTTVEGYQFVGGIVGEVAGKVIFGLQSADGATDKVATTAAVEAGDVANSSAATLKTYQIGSAPYSSALPTTGSFFGGASASATAGDIKIFGALTQATALRTADKWGYYVADGAEYFPWTISLIYNEIGHCGYTVAAPNVTVDTAFKDIEMYTTSTDATPTYSVKTKLVPFVGTQTQYNTAIATTATYGIGQTIYFDFVKKP